MGITVCHSLSSKETNTKKMTRSTIANSVVPGGSDAALLQTILQNFPGGIAVYDANLQMVICNERLKELLEYPEALFASGYPTLEDVYRCNANRGEYGPGDPEKQVRDRIALARNGIGHTFERVRPNGTVLEVRGTPLPGGGFVTVYLDITEQRANAQNLQTVVDNFPGGISVFDQDMRMVLCNERQKKMLDYPADLFENGHPSLEEVFRFNASRGEYGPGDVEELVAIRMERANRGEEHCIDRTRPNGRILEIRGVPLEGGGFVSTYIDVTEQRKSQAQIAHMAHHDPLTDLPNRALFDDRLEANLARAARGEVLAVLYLDLDKFKPVNDELGHAAGDHVLKITASRLKDCTRATDTVARLGGDEFAIIQVNLKDPSDASRLAERIIRSMSEPIAFERKDICIGTSIGIAVAPVDGDSSAEILRKADSALYRAKRTLRGTHQYFNKALQDRLP